MDPQEAEFRRVMRELGVKFSDGAENGDETRPHISEASHSPLPETDSLNDQNRDLFLAALEGSIPDKDVRSLEERKEGFRKLRSLKGKCLELEESLDLHGRKVDEALAMLASFVTHAFTHNLKSVVIITGKGKHSQDGVSILRPKVEQWILQKGKRFIRSYAEAPRAYGGRGAFILNLKSK